MVAVRNKLHELMLTDALNAARTQDALREKLVACLVSKADEMSPSELVQSIQNLSSLSNLEQYEKLSKIFSGPGGPGQRRKPQ